MIPFRSSLSLVSDAEVPRRLKIAADLNLAEFEARAGPVLHDG